jgi:hypothetical protein
METRIFLKAKMLNPLYNAGQTTRTRVIYEIVEATSSKTLVDVVNSFLEKGWELYGNLNVLGDYTGPSRYSQALRRVSNV